jgi:peptide/nickel transport system permease protein
MWRYIARRILVSIPVVFFVALITFSIMRLAPGDPVMMLLSNEDEQPDAETIANLERQLGLDKPLPKQFWDWFAGVFTGNMGSSFRSGFEVSELIGPRLQPSISLAVLGLGLGVMVGVPLGVLAAWNANRLIDRGVMLFAVLGWSVPGFFLAYILIFVFAVKLGLFPVVGYVPISEGLFDFLRSLALPAFSVAIAIMALVARMTRSSMIEVLREDYIRTARSKGLRERIVMVRHALKPASIPVVTIVGIAFAGVITGVVVTETVYSINGLGRQLVDAVIFRDFPVIQSTMMLVAISYVVVNLVVDVLYVYIDPRIRY